MNKYIVILVRQTIVVCSGHRLSGCVLPEPNPTRLLLYTEPKSAHQECGIRRYMTSRLSRLTLFGCVLAFPVLAQLTVDQKIADFQQLVGVDRKSTRLNSSHLGISYAVF